MRSGSEFLIYVFIVGGILLFNIVMPLLAKKARQRQQEEITETASTPSPPEDEPLEEIWGRTPVAPPEAAAPAPLAYVEPPAAEPPSAIPERRRAAGALFRSRQDLRHAVVVMTVLGPCRALEPPDSR
jgi:hypothetical protein